MERFVSWFPMDLQFSQGLVTMAGYVGIVILVLLVALGATWIVRRSLLRLIHHLVRTNRLQWDDALINNHFFSRLSWFVPVVILHLAQDLLLPPDGRGAEILQRLIAAGFVLVTVSTINALLNGINDIYRTLRARSGKTIRGYVDAARIVTYVLGTIFLIAIITGRSPWGLLSVMGGLTAITMLVFRDSILGFVASIQLTGTDMIRVGDWIEMASHDADGEVIEISIHSVRVRNWDKTVTSIPTYALISHPFKNWRGMTESGGRRIKRSLFIDMTSIRFLTEDDLERFSEIRLLTDYIRSKQEEILAYNRQLSMDSDLVINGRCQTNIGLFRAYVNGYLRQNPNIRQDMTFLVRQLPPGPDGLPLQIYVFSAEQAWARYEAIQADIFDHLLAALPMFDLRLYQYPSGHDCRVAEKHLTFRGTD